MLKSRRDLAWQFSDFLELGIVQKEYYSEFLYLRKKIANYSGCLDFSKLTLYEVINTLITKQVFINIGIPGKNKILLLYSKVLGTADHLLGTKGRTVRKSYPFSQNLHSNERDKQ